MPDRRTTGGVRRRRGGVLAAAAACILLGGPGVAAQTELPEEPDPPSRPEPGPQPDPAEWSGSRFIEPFQGTGGKVSTESFPISGIMTKERRPAEQIVRVEVRFEGDDPTESDVGDVDDVQCIPDDPVPFVGGGTADDASTSYAFTVPAEASVWPCNGRYTIIAAGYSNQEISPHEMVATLSVAVPPAPVTSVDAAVGTDDPATVTVSWEPLAEEDLAVDAIGYRVERAGPADDGAFGPFEPVSDVVGVDGPTTFTESVTDQGDYRYRVRALRDGPDGPVPSPARDSAVAEVADVGGPSSTTTTATTRPNRSRSGPGAGGAASGPGRRGGGGVAGPPTTLDTGFESTLDYGDRTGGDSPELAGEAGRSVIRTDGEGIGLVAPVAGALVLLGWAGHIAYLNRLARQF